MRVTQLGKMTLPTQSCPALSDGGAPGRTPGHAIAGSAEAASEATSCIAYLVNIYPKVSHTFIRREIQAMERQGFRVERIAIRGWNDGIADREDDEERNRTQYVMKDGVGVLIGAALTAVMHAPLRFGAALAKALRMSWKADRSWPYHLMYLAQACHILALLRARKATHLHAHFGTNPAEVAMYVRLLGGPPYSFTVHGPEEFDKFEGIGLRQKVEHAAFVVAISSYGRSQLFRQLPLAWWPKVEVVHCGLADDYFDAPASEPPEDPRFVCVGRLCEQKGQLLLLNAFRRIVEHHPSATLVLAGDGEMRSQIEAQIDSLGLTSQVEITGWIDGDRVRQEILAARALVLPSFQEGLPVVLMEAMALYRPVISTYIAGIPELVRTGTGWLVPAGSTDALVDAMLQCLAATPKELSSMGKAAHAQVEKRHRITTEADKLARLIRSPHDAARIA